MAKLRASTTTRFYDPDDDDRPRRRRRSDLKDFVRALLWIVVVCMILYGLSHRH